MVDQGSLLLRLECLLFTKWVNFLWVLICIGSYYLIVNLVVFVDGLFPVFFDHGVPFVKHPWTLGGSEDVGSWHFLEEITFPLLKSVSITERGMEVARALSLIVMCQI
jgi:hypothetical protein